MATDHEVKRKKRGAGLLCAISSPSGGGKTSVIATLLQDNPDFAYSISATTRPRRNGEVDGVDYYFVTDEEFDAKIDGDDFIEWAVVHGFRYGTPKSSVDKMLEHGRVVLLDIDVIGGMNVRKEYPDRSLLIFLSPVTVAGLQERLQRRNSESPDEIKKRLDRLPMEMSYKDDYDLEIVNDDFKVTVKKVEAAILKHQAKMEA